MILPILLLGAHAVRRRLTIPKILLFWAIHYNQDTYQVYYNQYSYYNQVIHVTKDLIAQYTHTMPK